MASREEILARLRAASPPARELPEARRFGQRFPDLRAQFAQALEDAGGRCVQIPAPEALGAALEELAPYRNGARIASVFAGVPRGTKNARDCQSKL